MVENLGVVCAEHGLEAVTAEHDESSDDDDESSGDEAATSANANGASDSRDDVDDATVRLDDASLSLDDVSLDAAERGGVSLRETFGGAAKTKKQKPGENKISEQRSFKRPRSVPETELMEIHRRAEGGWSEKARRRKRTTRGFGKTNASREDFSDRNTSEAKKRAPPPSRERGFRHRRAAWSDGDGESDAGGDASAGDRPARRRIRFRMCFRIFRRRKSRRRTSPGAAGSPRTASVAAPGVTTRPRDASRGAGGARRTPPRSSPPPSLLDPGYAARRLYDRKRRAPRGSRGTRSDASISSRGVSRDTEIARDAAARALGPPRVTVEPDPDVRDDEGGENGVEGVEKLEKKRTRTVLGVSALDRPGLLHDISQGLNRLRVQLLHCEASVVANRSVSIWRLQSMDASTTREEIRTVIEALLSPTSGSQASKEKGQRCWRCARARGSGFSALVGRASADVNFRTTYGAAVVAMQRAGARPGGSSGRSSCARGTCWCSSATRTRRCWRRRRLAF